MRMRPVIAIAALLIAVGVAGVAWWPAAQAPDAGAAVGSPERMKQERLRTSVDDLDLDAAALPAPAYASRPTPASPSASLPPADLPLVERFELLDAAARRGNAAAACQLGAELARCDNLRRSRYMQAQSEREIRRLAREADAERVQARIDFIALRDKLIEDASRACEGADALPAMERMRYFGIAGRAGHVASMVEYLGIQHFGAATLIRDPGLAAEFRRDAPDFFRRALEAGEPRLLHAWVAASHLSQAAPLREFLPPEWRSIGFTAALLGQLGEEQRRQLGLGGGDDIEISEAERSEAERVYREHFAARASTADSAAQGPDDLRWLRNALDTERYRCDELAD